ncbi:cellulase-like family protein [Microbacterium keratanolyticum]|uniref:cellulase-like family protein n=1 Tax=Microbacterium keratanolyticum TaxID=67574 RepID=UPI003634C69F
MKKTLDSVTTPLSITMWDSSWLRRRYRGGGFEDWDRALSELRERGYNAVRIDCFPHLVAAGPDGRIIERFKDVPNQFPQFYGFGMWGNPWTMYIEPRAALIEFLTKCREHGVKVALSTWFKPTDDRRNEQIEGLDGFVRVWQETLEFIDSHGLMDTVVYLDVLNEYPYGHVFSWLHKTVGTMAYPPGENGGYNERQQAFLWKFLTDAIERLRASWPVLTMSASFTFDGFERYWEDRVDFEVLDFLDVHIWLNYFPGFNELTNFHRTIERHGNPNDLFTVERGGNAYAEGSRLIPQDYHYDEIYATIRGVWHDERSRWLGDFEDRIGRVVDAARPHGLHVGQTEAWGLVNWADHPLLDWDIHRESAEIGAEIAARRGYTFNCSSNFTHPHFLGFWDNVPWHRAFTDTVRTGVPRLDRDRA